MAGRQTTPLNSLNPHLKHNSVLSLSQAQIPTHFSVLVPFTVAHKKRTHARTHVFCMVHVVSGFLIIWGLQKQEMHSPQLLPLLLLYFRSDGVVVPIGKSKDTGVVNPNGYTLNYNGETLWIWLSICAPKALRCKVPLVCLFIFFVCFWPSPFQRYFKEVPVYLGEKSIIKRQKQTFKSGVESSLRKADVQLGTSHSSSQLVLNIHPTNESLTSGFLSPL